ncbi:HDOD domain-containing protein [Amphritea sp. 2_MG-2023]|uniref:EAL and HDOD domain-containing protein n=1 Tax=Amphritea TaxID=515417 RepID=UPI001C0769D0|nr:MULTISPECIES: HDOD domain-containing protein [Amphritea]MBU2964218.1 HDOD domain-containing protein [Amphritea atlantica]MDO6419525.1 HDOD domain-containing protein [Amphritea sp. 2_MG-2023]
MAQDILMARQPIFDANLNVVAYELLYRDVNNQAPCLLTDGNSATSQVLLNNYTSICHSSKVTTVPAFINMTKEMLESAYIPELSRKHIVLEILEDIEVDELLILSVKRYIDAGYRMALDDFIYSPEYDPILKMVHIVKLDLLALTDQELEEHTKLLKRFNVTLLAEKIETLEEFNRCKALGFKLFQGYFLCKPQIVEGRKLSSNETVMLELMALLTDPLATTAAVSEIVKRDPQLTLKIVRIVNSSLFNLIRKIDSIDEAVTLLGTTEIKRWCALMAVSGEHGKLDELTRHTLVRARMCELLAENQPNLSGSSGFMMGIFAGLDTLLDTPKDDILKQVVLNEDIEIAIREGLGPYGELLTTVNSFILGEWDSLPLAYNPERLNQAYQDSLGWVLDTMERMAA